MWRVLALKVNILYKGLEDKNFWHTWTSSLHSWKYRYQHRKHQKHLSHHISSHL